MNGISLNWTQLTAIEECSASAARPKAKKVVATSRTASSSLNGSFIESDAIKDHHSCIP